jgi:DNA-binding MurR/RpiR family transcriptional regulator
LEDYPQTALLTARRLASEAGVSAPSVSRFTAKLGYGNFIEFQEHLRSELRARLESPSVRARIGSGRRQRTSALLTDSIERDIENLRKTLAMVNPEVVDRLVGKLAQGSGAVYITGSKKARVLAEYLAIQLNQIRPRVRMLAVDDGLPDAMLDVESRDILVAFEPRRATNAVVRTVAMFQQAGAAVAVICDEFPPAVLARVDFPIPVPLGGASIFDSYTAMLAVINGIVGALVARMPHGAPPRVDRLESINQAYATWYETRPQ